MGPETLLVVRGAQLNNDDQRVLRTFVSQLELALESRRLQAEVAAAATLADTDALRAALLQAVSHDLRTPLASIKASATSLLQDDVAWSDKERAEFLATIDAESDRLDALVGNLLDMSRLQAGAVEVVNRPVFLEDVVANAMASLACGQDPRIEVSVPETVPPVEADPGVARAGGGQRRVERRRLVARRSSDPRGGRRGGRCRPPRVSWIRDPGSARRSASGCSSRSSASGTAATRPASGWGWPSPEASCRPWAAASCSTTRPAGD